MHVLRVLAPTPKALAGALPGEPELVPGVWTHRELGAPSPGPSTTQETHVSLQKPESPQSPLPEPRVQRAPAWVSTRPMWVCVGLTSFRPAPEALGPGSRDTESQRETVGDLSLSRVAKASTQQPEADETQEVLLVLRAQGPHAPN